MVMGAGVPDMAEDTLHNRATYERQDVVRAYRESERLQAPEQTILRLLGPRLGEMRMLDIGVGGGRTTQYFAPLVRQYTGIDYSASMIETCAARFGVGANGMSFKVCDARSMESFPDQSFELVLFSFNGLDYVGHSDRMKALAEIRRVTRPDGCFCFSSHNLNSSDQVFGLRHQFSGNPLKITRKLARWVFVRYLYNRSVNVRSLATQAHELINDGTFGFRLQAYYVRPLEQLRQLAGWTSDVQVLGLSTGAVLGPMEIATARDSWLYYVCKVS